MAKDRESEVEKREQVRNSHRELMQAAIDNDDEEQADESYYVLNNTDLNKYAFDELKNKKEYTDVLLRNVLEDTGEAYEGDIEDLIEDDFEHWNLFTNNLTAGIGKIAQNVATMTDQEKADNLVRYTTYDDTDSFGEGSRDWWEQTKGVGLALATDPLTYTLAGNIPKLAAKTAQSAMIKKLFEQGTGAPLATAIMGGAMSGANDLNMQAQRSSLGGEGIDPIQTATATSFGSVAPAIGQYAGKAIGPVIRTAVAPIEALKSGAGHFLAGSGNRLKMATQELYGIGETAVKNKAKLQAKLQSDAIKRGELFNTDNFSKSSKVEPKFMKFELAKDLVSNKDKVAQILQSPAALKSIQTYFPENATEFKNIEKLVKGLSVTKTNGKKIGENIIKSILADSITGVPGTRTIFGKIKGAFTPAKVMNNGTKQSWFISGLLNTYKKRGGRLNTIWGEKIKKTYNLTDAQLGEFQDYTYGLMANIPTQAFYRERHKDFKEKGTTMSY
jgi:hypothetical protein